MLNKLKNYAAKVANTEAFTYIAVPSISIAILIFAFVLLISLLDDDGQAKISKVQTHALNVLYPEFITRTTPDVQENLYNMLDRYARTPIEKREEEKKYRLRLDVNNKIENNWQILGKNRNDGAYHKGFVKEEI